MRRSSTGTWLGAWMFCTGLAAVVPQAALAGECNLQAIPGGRFVEAAKLCARTNTSIAIPAARPLPPRTRTTAEPMAERGAVSISMPSARHRRAAFAYTRRGRAVPQGGAAASHSALIVAVAQRYRINPRLLASMMQTESAGNPRAVSNKGALGLMQVMPGTARSLGIAEPRAMLGNPALAMSAGAAYLKKLQRQIGNDVPLVVAAYNAGPGAVMRAKRRVPRYRETQGYVRSVMGRFAPNQR